MDTIKYGVPDFIMNDGLKDTLVQIDFESEYNRHKLESVLFDFLQKPTNDEVPFQMMPLRKQDPMSSNSPIEQYVCNNGTFKVLVKESRVLFNCARQYVGWNHYSTFIISCLPVLMQYVKVRRVSIRYISEYLNFKISTVLDWEYKFNFLPASVSNMFEIRYRVENPPYNATAIAKIYDNSYINNELKSLIDITISSKVDGTTISNIEDVLQFCHKYEKDFYFRLLKKEFVDSKLP